MRQPDKVPTEILRTMHRSLHRVMAQKPELVAKVMAMPKPKTKANKYPPGVAAMLRRYDRS